MGVVAFVGFAFIKDFGAALGLLQVVPYDTFASYDLSVIPLFILMGEFAFHAGVSQDLYGAVQSWLGRLRGGLAMATIGGCAGFAAVCGSSVATAATMGTVALPEMRKRGYDPALATGCVAAGGTLGILIPPSIGFIVYGVITQQSIGKLFLAGFLPGLLLAGLFIATIVLLCRLNPLAGPPGNKTSFKEKLQALKKTWTVAALFLFVIGGIYLGVFTPTEAAGMGAFATFLLGLARGRLDWRAVQTSVSNTGKTTGMIFLILLGAVLFSYFLAVSGVPAQVANTIEGLAINRYLVLAVIVVIYLILGCVMDALAMILITLPIFFPLIAQLGFDPIWFGIIVTLTAEAGLISPPVGMNVFVIQGISNGVPMYTIFRGIVPFFVALIIGLVVLTVFPQIALVLPNLMS
jgi:tripartite ATP-independent transporter DctM subunit